MPARAFGLDMSDAWIRLAVLDKGRRGLRLPIRGEIPIPSGLIMDGEIQNPQQVSARLRELLKAAGIRHRQAYVSLPERHTFIKMISLPADHPDNLAQTVKDEAQHHLPYAWDEVYFDWLVLPHPNSQGQAQALIGAAPRSLVDTYLSVLEASEIEPIGMDIESLAIARASFRPPPGQGATVLLDLGRTRSTLILVQTGVVLFSATVRYAGKELNRYIADELKISQDQAERAKRIFGLDPNRGKGLLRRVLAPQLDVLVEKVREVEAFYVDHMVDHQPIHQVVLTGSGALLRNIDHELQSRLGRPVVLQPSWVFEDIRQHDQSPQAELGYTYATAIGLALLNFA